MITIYHNSSCSKSRAALTALAASEKPFQVVEYLKAAPSVAELREIIEKLGVRPHDLVRTGEAVYIENYKGRALADEEWVEAMHQHPILIQRPIIINGERATIARSEESIKAAF